MSMSVVQATFTGGEWTPSLWSRSDLDKYGTAVKLMRNFFPHPHGGASNRQGTYFIKSTKNSATKTCRIYPFQFSVTQGYLLEIGDQYIRFYKDGGIITSNKTITGAANNGSGKVRITATGHQYNTGMEVTISGIVGTTEANTTAILTYVDANHFDLLTVNFVNAYVSGGTAVGTVELASPWLEADLELLKFEQSADVLYVTHPSYEPRKITRSSHYVWTLNNLAFASAIAAPTNLTSSGGTGSTYAVTAVNSDGIESTPSGSVTSAIDQTLTWDDDPDADHWKIYQVINGTYQYICRSEIFSGAKIPNNKADPDDTAPSDYAPFNGVNNYPGVAAFFGQRLVFGRTNTKPQTVFGTVIGDFENFNVSEPVKDDDSYEFTINSNQVNEIRWMAALDNLIIGTSGSEWRMSPGGQTNSITPTSVKLTQQSKFGSANIPAIIIGSSVLFIEASKKKIRDLTYSLEIDGYKGGDLSILANHLFEVYGVKQWAYQQHPDSIIWCVREDGGLMALTYLKEHSVWGWSRHDTDGFYESVAAVQNSEGTHDVYFVVRRVIDGNTVRYVEKMARRDFTSIEDAYFVDCGLSYDGAPETVFGGLSHLEGKTVAVLADGNLVSNLVVTSGTITIPQAASVVHIGLPYTCDIHTLGFEFATRSGPIKDKIRYIKNLILSLRDTRAVWVGTKESNILEVPFREDEDYGEATRLFTGDKEIFVEPGDNRDGSIFLRVQEALPCTVQAIMARMVNGSQ